MPKSCLTTEFIHSDLFSGGSNNFLSAVLKNDMLGFAQIISVFRTGWRFARVCVGTRYPEHVAVRRSVNGGLVRVCFSVTPGLAVSMREN